MKINMTNHKSILIGIGICLIIALSSFLSQQTPNHFITIRTIEYKGPISPESRLVIVDDMGELRDFELEKVNGSGSMGNNTKSINEVINKLSKKGYQLVSTSSGGLGDQALITTFIMKK
ncbi:MAG: hypothetical protein K0S32_4128 [Bacteroidetes bacterium]|jgi:hypothetical protein|nr:hypothetical protein [Bacteroidota bacterium]